MSLLKDKYIIISFDFSITFPSLSKIEILFNALKFKNNNSILKGLQYLVVNILLITILFFYF